MKDGYYLSTFLAFDPLANAIGVKLRHDQNASLWKKTGPKVELLSYWEIERITGKKQHSDTFRNKENVEGLLNYLLKDHNLSLTDMNDIWGTSGLETRKNFYHKDNYAFHSICHLFSSFFVKGSDVFKANTILALAADCGPDNLWEDDAFSKGFYAGAISIKGNIEYFSINSPGHLWSHAKKRLGLREGTLMALATASETKFLTYEPPVFTRAPITNRAPWPEMSDYIDQLIAKARAVTTTDAGKIFSGFDPRFTDEENIISMVMKDVQETSNIIMQQNVAMAIERYNLNPQETLLALSGGFCLNCPSNTHLMNKFGFKDLLAPPCINDAGISLGQALYYFYYETNGSFETPTLSPYLGQEFQTPQLDEFKAYIHQITPFDEADFVKDLQENPVVWFNGKSEIGPRSLGNRSLLSDPRTIEMKDALNTLKKREWWRPVAPIVLEEALDKCFLQTRRSPYMLELFDVKDNMRAAIPAVCHLDATARVQTLAQSDNPLLHRAIHAFYRETGVPMICNTSLNDNKEPIINSPQEAMNFALRKGLPVAYIEGQRYALMNHGEYKETEPTARNTSFCIPATHQNLPEENPYSLNTDEVTVYWDYKHELGDQALKSLEKVEEIKKMANSIKNRYGYLAR